MVCCHVNPDVRDLRDWNAQGVKLKGKSQGSDTTAGIWHHVLDGDFKIAETWFLRQLSSDEVDRKVRACDIMRHATCFFSTYIRHAALSFFPKHLDLLLELANLGKSMFTADGDISNSCGSY